MINKRSLALPILPQELHAAVQDVSRNFSNVQ